jgi:hypothetical protein
MIILGLTGAAGSGKDTAADYLVQAHGFTKVFHAEPIYAMLAAMGFPAPDTRDLKEAVDPFWGFSWREAAQTLGTEWGRSLSHDIWLNALKVKLKKLEAEGVNKVVVSDARFANEAEHIRQVGTLIAISGRKADLQGRESHKSEAGFQLSIEDKSVDNTQGYGYLYSQLDYIVNEVNNG